MSTKWLLLPTIAAVALAGCGSSGSQGATPSAQPVALQVAKTPARPLHMRLVHKHKPVVHSAPAYVTASVTVQAQPQPLTAASPAPVSSAPAPQPASAPAPTTTTAKQAPAHEHKKKSTGTSAGGTPLNSQGY